MLANASLDDPAWVPLAPLLTSSGLDGALVDDDTASVPAGPDSTITIGPAEVRTLHLGATAPIARLTCGATEAAAMPRVVVETVMPSVDDGRFPAKRQVGEMVEVSADLFADGHDRIAAALLWRPADEEAWREAPMAAIGNDRWVGRFPLGRIGRHLFTILAWKDCFGNFAEELEKKHAAGLPIDLELEEGRLLVLEMAAQGRLEPSPPILPLSPTAWRKPIPRSAAACCSPRRTGAVDGGGARAAACASASDGIPGRGRAPRRQLRQLVRAVSPLAIGRARPSRNV